MDADAFRQLYDYHFAANRKVWDEYVVPLEEEKFLQPLEYSIGSVRNHVVHLMSVDHSWFSGLRGEDIPPIVNPVHYAQKDKIRTEWDSVEAKMREYLAGLRDKMLFERPFPDGEDEVLILWQVLLHVVNHGTDHRAQLLRMLHDLGVKTTAQDYIFYLYGDL